MKKLRVGIVIPALNEAATISATVTGVKAFGEVIVVDDGSGDKTAELALQAGANVRKHSVNRGYDEALNTGFAYAHQLGCNVIITFDADGQHNPTLLPRFIQEMENGADMILGVRNKYHRFAERVFALYTILRFGIRDPLCGMKAYRAHLYNRLGHFDSYGSVGTELMLFAAKNKCRMEQIDFTVRDRSDKSRFGQIIRGNTRILKALFRGIIKQG